VAESPKVENPGAELVHMSSVRARRLAPHDFTQRWKCWLKPDDGTADIVPGRIGWSDSDSVKNTLHSSAFATESFGRRTSHGILFRRTYRCRIVQDLLDNLDASKTAGPWPD